MHMKNKTLAKKFLTLVLLVSTLFASIPAPKAEAWVDFADLIPDWIQGAATPAAVVTTGGTTVTTGATVVTTGAGVVVEGTQTAWQIFGKNALDALAYGVAQRILSALTENVITWIKGGFHGSPSFAVDTQQIIDDIVESAAGDMIREVKNLSVCQFSADVNFVDDLADSIALSTAKKKKKKFVPTCPFESNLNFTFGASEFYNDFNRGGWALFGAALEAGGSPYDVQIATADELERRKQTKTAASDKKLSWSNGFTDIVDTDNCNYPEEMGHLVAIYKAHKASPSSVTPEELAEIGGIDAASVKAWDAAYCKTTTPGKIVGDQLTKTLGMDMDRLGFADNMNKIISAFLDVMTQKALRGVFTKKASPSATSAPRLTAAEKVLLDEKVSMDSNVSTKTQESTGAKWAYSFAVKDYDDKKEVYDIIWADYNNTENPTDSQQALLDDANIALKNAALTVEQTKAEDSYATDQLSMAKDAAKTKYTKEILTARN